MEGQCMKERSGECNWRIPPHRRTMSGGWNWKIVPGCSKKKRWKSGFPYTEKCCLHWKKKSRSLIQMIWWLQRPSRKQKPDSKSEDCKTYSTIPPNVWERDQSILLWDHKVVHQLLSTQAYLKGMSKPNNWMDYLHWEVHTRERAWGILLQKLGKSSQEFQRQERAERLTGQGGVRHGRATNQQPFQRNRQASSNQPTTRPRRFRLQKDTKTSDSSKALRSPKVGGRSWGRGCRIADWNRKESRSKLKWESNGCQELNWQPEEEQHMTQRLKVGSWNACNGIASQLDYVKTAITEYDLDILLIQESELPEECQENLYYIQE